jgi:hypothetical protein
MRWKEWRLAPLGLIPLKDRVVDGRGNTLFRKIALCSDTPEILKQKKHWRRRFPSKHEQENGGGAPSSPWPSLSPDLWAAADRLLQERVALWEQEHRQRIPVKTYNAKKGTIVRWLLHKPDPLFFLAIHRWGDFLYYQRNCRPTPEMIRGKRARRKAQARLVRTKGTTLSDG